LYPATEMKVLAAALFYLEHNISVLPVIGKKPAMYSWSETQVKRVPFSWVHNWSQSGLLRGVGIVCGKVSENLVVIDLDGIDRVQTFRAAFPHLFETYEVLSGSGNGRHLYFYVDELPPTTRTKGYELRANGCYVVAPPSLHPDTQKPYMPLNQRPVTRLKDLNDVVAWIKDRVVKPPLKPKEVEPTTPPDFITDGYQKTAQNFYFNAALEGEVKRVEMSRPGNQNNTLNIAAFCMGGYVRSAADYQQVESKLLEAALSVGQPELQSRRTITSGLEAGMKKPRPFPGVRGKNNA
jgi:bifunctional DNA primase/polymerase-like protein